MNTYYMQVIQYYSQKECGIYDIDEYILYAGNPVL